MTAMMSEAICWINTISESHADAELGKIYDRVRGKNGQLDNLYQAFSLRPHTILPADDLYLAAMHADDNSLPKRFSELIGTYVAILTCCDYAQLHHGHNFQYLFDKGKDKEQGDGARVMKHLKAGNLEHCGDEREVTALHYVRKLVLQPESICKSDIEQLRRAGWSDGDILEIVQVVAMFSYFIRVINGIGIQIGDETPGLY